MNTILLFAGVLLILSGCVSNMGEISEEQAIEIALRAALEEGAGEKDLEGMLKKVEDRGENFLVTIYPDGDSPNYDVTVVVDKQGKVESVVLGNIASPSQDEGAPKPT